MQNSKRRTRRMTCPIYHIPPTAFPVALKDLAAGASAALYPSRAIGKLKDRFGTHSGRKQILLMDSGRLALKMILLAIKEGSPANKVLMPAYGCSTLLQSVLEAGLQPEFCDLSLKTLDYDHDQIFSKIQSDLLAVIGVHLYGLVHDYSVLVDEAHSRGLVFIVDAAQSFGSSIRGVPSGIQGDIGFYSLGRGKCLPAGGGGVIIPGPGYGEMITATLNKYPLSSTSGVKALATMFAYLLAVNPFGWWFISRSKFNPALTGNNLSQLPDIQHRALSAIQAGIANSLFNKKQKAFDTWVTNAREIVNILREIQYITVPPLQDGLDPVFLRLPIIVDSVDRTEQLFNKLWKAGIGVSRSYQYTLPRLLHKESNGKADTHYPSAAHLSTCLLTLPTNRFVKEREIDEISRIFRSI